jgi:3-dehydroquinate synthetase
MKKIICRIGKHDVPFFTGTNCIEQLVNVIQDFKFDKLFIGMDDNSSLHHGKYLISALEKRNIPHTVCIIRPGENFKTFTSLDYILSTFIQNGCSRASIVMPFGGGIVGNIFGLAAGLLFRGIRLIHFPTTFLSMHDSVTSQKQAINCMGYKNNVGLYHLPLAVLCDISVLNTLDESNIKSGLGELVKNAILFGGEFYSILIGWLNVYQDLKLSNESFSDLVELGIRAKDQLLKQDSEEKGVAIIFEYGHTIGHAIELACPKNSISHGEAITVGMLASSFIANKMKIMSDQDREVHDCLIKKIHPHIPYLGKNPLPTVINKVLHDNKRGYLPQKEGTIPMILVKRIGELYQPNSKYLEYVPEEEVVDAVSFVLRHFNSSPKPIYTSF